MKLFRTPVALAAASLLAACGATEYSHDYGDAVVSTTEHAAGIDGTLVRAADQVQAASLSCAAGADTAELTIGNATRVLPVGAEGRALDARSAAEALYSAWTVDGEAQRCICSLWDYTTAWGSCGALTDIGYRHQCVRDVLNDICCL